MQVSELSPIKLKKICFFLRNKKIRALYFADSLGALDIRKFKKIIGLLKSFGIKILGYMLMII